MTFIRTLNRDGEVGTKVLVKHLVGYGGDYREVVCERGQQSREGPIEIEEIT